MTVTFGRGRTSPPSKNWSPFVHDGELHLLAALDPLVVLRCSEPEAAATTIECEVANCAGCEENPLGSAAFDRSASALLVLRGGTQLEELPRALARAGDARFVGFAHSTLVHCHSPRAFYATHAFLLRARLGSSGCDSAQGLRAGACGRSRGAPAWELEYVSDQMSLALAPTGASASPHLAASLRRVAVTLSSSPFVTSPSSIARLSTEAEAGAGAEAAAEAKAEAGAEAEAAVATRACGDAELLKLTVSINVGDTAGHCAMVTMPLAPLLEAERALQQSLAAAAGGVGAGARVQLPVGYWNASVGGMAIAACAKHLALAASVTGSRPVRTCSSRSRRCSAQPWAATSERCARCSARGTWSLANI